MLLAWVKHHRSNKRMVTYPMMRHKALAIASELNIDNFKCSTGFIQSFCQRHGFVYRAATHKAQENNKTGREVCGEAIDYINLLATTLRDLTFDHILNMDETPLYFDVMHERTVDELGARSVEVAHTGANKSRFTVVLTIEATGKIWKTMLIFKGKTLKLNKKSPSTCFLNHLKGLVNPPACNYPPSITATTSKSAMMSTDLMLQYINNVLAPALVPENKSALLIMDQHKSHMTQQVLDALAAINVTPLVLPGRIYHNDLLFLEKLNF